MIVEFKKEHITEFSVFKNELPYGGIWNGKLTLENGKTIHHEKFEADTMPEVLDKINKYLELL